MSTQTSKSPLPRAPKKTRVYGRIDKKILVQALGQGLTKAEAGRLAGSKAKDARNITNRVSEFLNKDTNGEEKKTIIEMLAEKQRKILESIRPQDYEKAPLNQKTIALGIITDKLQLLKGDPTERIETIPRMVISNTNTARTTNTPQEGASVKATSKGG